MWSIICNFPSSYYLIIGITSASIAPPFYETMWFIGLMCGLGGLLALVTLGVIAYCVYKECAKIKATPSKPDEGKEGGFVKR